ncbi:MAG: prephenate dehydratase, partial [archaeon]|nr:prephenate dehydratase [archaeon]
FGIVPIENSLEGSVRESLDLLIEKNLKIYGETEIRIVHNLIAAKGTKISDIKMVLSHPQALSQCNTWLLKNIPNVELMETSSTARAVEKVKGNKNYAAIGTKLAAKLNNLEIISAGIEENTQNFTRFLVISKKENMPTKNDKISMVFVVKHIPGALHQVIKIFAEANINLLKIESRPRKSQMWEYFFLMDFEGSILDQKIQDTLEKMKEFTIWHKILGSYPRNF